MTDTTYNPVPGPPGSSGDNAPPPSASAGGAINDGPPPGPPGQPGPPHADDAGGRKPTILEKVVKIANAVEAFRSTDDEVFASVPDPQGRLRTLKVRSKDFKGFLHQAFMKQYRQTISEATLDDACSHVESAVRYGDLPTIDVFYRLGTQDGAIYLDLGNDAYQVVEITSQCWTVLDTSPVKFRRPKSMLSLPVPIQGGKLSDLRPFVNVPDADWPKLAGFLIGALRPEGPHPLLEIIGERGSAKSTCGDLVQSLIDPTTTGRRSAPKDERDLAIGFKSSRLPMYDNLSKLSVSLSDMFCRVSTGGTFATRLLYSNDEEMVFCYNSPAILTGIQGVVQRADLLSRTLTLELPRIDDSKRQLEAELKRDFEAVRPQILGAMLDAAVCALRRFDEVSDYQWPRLADFCHWVTAAEPSLGWPPGTFVRCIQKSTISAAERALERYEQLVSALKTLAQRGGVSGWTGTATDLHLLLGKLPSLVGTALPRSANALSELLTELGPALRDVGVRVERTKQGHESTKFITLRWELPEIIAGIVGTEPDFEDGNR